MERSLRVAVLALLWPLAALGCTKPASNDSASSTSPPPVDIAPHDEPASDNAGSTGAEGQAAVIFKSRCATCHGLDGKGNGPAALTLNPKPRNYTDAAWQKAVTDDQIRETIVKGGAAVGKSPMMAPNQDLEGKPAVVDALVKKIRAFAPK